MDDEGDDDFSEQAPSLSIRFREAMRALDLITERLDPFERPSGVFDWQYATAFRETSATEDIGLLFEMCAKPGTQWSDRFVVSTNSIMHAPCEGRDSIPSASTYSGNFFPSTEYTSLEGPEVTMMYGYSLKSRDFEYNILPLAFRDPNNLSMLKLGIAASQVELKLDQCLGMAIGGSHSSFMNHGTHHSSVELARILLKAGASPNGYCFQGETPYDFVPAVFQAIKDRDEEMTRLLVCYGADVSKSAQFSSWTDEGELDIEHVSIQTIAEQANTTELLLPPATALVADPESYAQELRKEFEAPLRRLIAEHSLIAEHTSILVVAMMRSTGRVPRAGLISTLILDYCPLEFNLWKIESE